VTVVKTFAKWAEESWDVNQLPQALSHLPEIIHTAEKELKVGKRECMMVLRHALGGEKVRHGVIFAI